MNNEQVVRCLHVLTKYYGDNAKTADAEVEIANLRRKFKDGTLDDRQRAIVAELMYGKASVNFRSAVDWVECEVEP